MILNAFLFCGILFSFYTFQKIFLNYEQFVLNYENEFEDTKNINFFLCTIFITCIIAWPAMIISEIKNR